MFARGYAFIASFDTTFVVFRWHNVSHFLFVSVCRERRVRKIPPLMLRRGAASLWDTTVDYGRTPPRRKRILPRAVFRRTVGSPACASVDATRTSFVFTYPVRRTLSRSKLALKVLIETFSLRRCRSLFKAAHFENASHQCPVVKRG
jgi:hypothetical protein